MTCNINHPFLTKAAPSVSQYLQICIPCLICSRLLCPSSFSLTNYLIFNYVYKFLTFNNFKFHLQIHISRTQYNIHYQYNKEYYKKCGIINFFIKIIKFEFLIFLIIFNFLQSAYKILENILYITGGVCWGKSVYFC